ncbi:unnamed protein product [Ambrosiozyma monospora]|uniref:Unnamed protein product n=1 Tax=Ambrosiozyma monospora TaxID=43982 RepID=A0ACB5SXV0_AMBMO|nr:unnamed protein product [Ambrosiozyma monospora]
MVLSDIILLLEQDSPFNRMIFNLLRESRLVFDLDSFGRTIITIEHITGSILDSSPLISQLGHAMKSNSVKFSEVTCSQILYGQYANSPISSLFNEGLKLLVDLSTEINIDILEGEIDLETWGTNGWITRVRKSCFIVKWLRGEELMSYKKWLPKMVNMKELEIRFCASPVVNLNLFLQALGTLQALKKLRFVLLLSFSSMRNNSDDSDPAELFKKFAALHKNQFTVKVIRQGIYLIDYDGESPEETIAKELEPLKSLITGLNIEVNITQRTEFGFGFLKSYRDLEELTANASEIAGLSEMEMKLKSFDGIPFDFPKLKSLYLYGFVIDKKMFESLPNSLAFLLIRDCNLSNRNDRGLHLLKFPTGLQVFRFRSKDETKYKYPVIENSSDLTSLHTVEIDTSPDPFSLIGFGQSERALPQPFLGSLPTTLRTFNMRAQSSDFDWNRISFLPLKSIQKLTLNFSNNAMKTIPPFNLDRIPSSLIYLDLSLANRDYIGRLHTPLLRHLYIDLGSSDDLAESTNKIIAEVKQLETLTIGASETAFRKRKLNLRELQFSQFPELTLILFNMEWHTHAIKIPDFPVTFRKLNFDFIENDLFSDDSPDEDYWAEYAQLKLQVVAKKLSSSVKNCHISSATNVPVELVVRG